VCVLFSLSSKVAVGQHMQPPLHIWSLDLAAFLLACLSSSCKQKSLKELHFVMNTGRIKYNAVYPAIIGVSSYFNVNRLMLGPVMIL